MIFHLEKKFTKLNSHWSWSQCLIYKLLELSRNWRIPPHLALISIKVLGLHFHASSNLYFQFSLLELRAPYIVVFDFIQHFPVLKAIAWVLLSLFLLLLMIVFLLLLGGWWLTLKQINLRNFYSDLMPTTLPKIFHNLIFFFLYHKFELIYVKCI